MDLYQQINQIPILDILDKLDIGYEKISNSYRILEDGKLTDGWSINVKDNYINDFSSKDRAVGQPFVFIRSYLGLTNRETFEWFKDNFSITMDLTKKTKTKKKTNKPRLPTYKGSR